MTEDEALQIAVDHAKADPYGRFPEPFAEEIQAKNRTWIIKILSRQPSGLLDGGHYMYVSINGETGEAATVSVGGGS